MKKTILISIIFYCCFFSNAQNKSNLKIDTKFGFRDLILESDFSTINNKYNLKEEFSVDLVKGYGLKGMDMYIDDIPIEYITVSFIDNKLYRILIHIISNDQVSQLTNMIEANYGKLNLNEANYIYFIKGKKAELSYESWSPPVPVGSIEDKTRSYIEIKSIKLKKRITGSNTGF
jgi:hypothetical protein